jgi:trehalose 2-sulfotransferase
MKGIVVLTEGRSGSNWLGSLTDSTGQHGRFGEWLDHNYFPCSAVRLSAAKFVDRAVDAACTDEFFALKIFPKHFFWFRDMYSLDVVKALRDSHDVRFIRLRREDTVGQAVSFARAIKTRSWSSTQPRRSTATYDFELILRCYFSISQSYEFWRKYCDLAGLAAPEFFYEDLCKDAKPYLGIVSSFSGQPIELGSMSSRFDVQRDDLSEVWRARFVDQFISSQKFPDIRPSASLKNTVNNILRKLAGKPQKPVNFTIR